jgi:hypothetical protein
MIAYLTPARIKTNAASCRIRFSSAPAGNVSSIHSARSLYRFQEIKGRARNLLARVSCSSMSEWIVGIDGEPEEEVGVGGVLGDRGHSGYGDLRLTPPKVS